MTLNLLINSLNKAKEYYPISDYNPEIYIKDESTDKIYNLNTIHCRNVNGIFLIINEKDDKKA